MIIMIAAAKKRTWKKQWIGLAFTDFKRFKNSLPDIISLWGENIRKFSQTTT
jgi:hypothetical protein